MSVNYTGAGIPIAERAGAFQEYDSFVTRPMELLSGGEASKICNAMGQSRSGSRHPPAALAAWRMICRLPYWTITRM